MDETYHTYLNRVARLTLPATYESQVQHIQESPKFKPSPSGTRQAVPFPGYSAITPPAGEESENATFYESLKACQEQLLQQLDPGFIVPVPAESFHVTLADLIWDSAYRHTTSENPEFEEQLRDRIAQIFEQSQPSLSGGNPMLWQLLGLMVMPRAVAVCLVPKDEGTYERMLKFRRFIYQSRSLIELGIEQQYRFTAHVTLGYFGDISPDLNRARLCEKLSQINDQWLENSPEIWTHQAQLRKFDDMTRYYREPDWPVLTF
ncbi:DUF1868 domain-containing protein [Coleofasciculus sp. FACHB-542]|uniref:DUF1868 domain-containing protein n=1 Tax=Coleofasciculus sp. FACHB-542 TaxID=2692787 RepID=UPI00168A33F9|nr:DUF1868 domain-containing protein [Coleofasciculus sp. FACHB-542]MBD2086424.1 DUF1868 domain-containing protein [Coleofasciculus sp. FACHB-542]